MCFHTKNTTRLLQIIENTKQQSKIQKQIQHNNNSKNTTEHTKK